jgi:hypothetical protein
MEISDPQGSAGALGVGAGDGVGDGAAAMTAASNVAASMFMSIARIAG